MKKRGPMKKKSESTPAVRTDLNGNVIPNDFASDPRWQKDVAGWLLKMARAVRTGNMSGTEILANFQSMTNVLSEHLDAHAIEDPESKTTLVFKNARVVPDDPSYR